MLKLFGYFIRTTMNPAMYHGLGKKPPYFEGWYFKLVSADEQHRFAIIPGVFVGEGAHAFVQVLNGSNGNSTYHRFSISEFWASEDKFEVRIAGNTFTQESVSLNIDDELGQVIGKLVFDGITPWPVSKLSPGIMGWYAWVPKMECYHGVLSMDHKIYGSLGINGSSIDFSDGHGYIEKDWGQSFPSGYVWFQCNHFETPGSSLTASIALIPWLGSAFRGFIVGLWHQNQLYRFATYTGARTESLTITDNQVKWVIGDRLHRLEMTARRMEGGLLHAPTRSEMLQRVEETMLASVDVRLTSLAGEIIFAEHGRNTALEVNGNLDQLLSTT